MNTVFGNQLHNSSSVDLYEDPNFTYAMQLVNAAVLPMALRAATELDLFEIIARAGPGAQLSPSQIASQLPSTQNPQASAMLDRVLRYLASYSVLTCSVVTTVEDDGQVQRLYGLAPVCKYLVEDQDGATLSPWLNLDKGFMDSLYNIKDAVMEGVVPFRKVYGMSTFEYMNMNSNQEKLKKPQPMYTKLVVKKVLETYRGFEDQKLVIDVGGLFGTMIGMVTAKYPMIKGINFDLPNVVEMAPPVPGVEHVGGDMFASVPTGDVMILKSILHDWKDEECITILKNCYQALPDNGKVVIVEMAVPEVPEPNPAVEEVFSMDLWVMVNGGKERTKQEFHALAKGAGFVGADFICHVLNYWVIELNKK